MEYPGGIIGISTEAACLLLPVPPWTVAQATERIQKLLPPALEGRELGAFLPGVPEGDAGRDLRCRAAVAATFCDALEFAREEELILSKLQPWDSVTLRAVTRASDGDRSV